MPRALVRTPPRPRVVGSPCELTHTPHPTPLRSGRCLHYVRRVALSVDALLDGARTVTRLSDFGDPTFRDGLEVLVEAIEREGDPNAVGRMALEGQLAGYLCERLRVEDWYRRHPDIAAERIE